jgi:hypothetical protein
MTARRHKQRAVKIRKAGYSPASGAPPAASTLEQRIPVLDSIRGILLVWMALDHFGGAGPVTQWLYQRLGFFGAAEGFFFLSGFVSTQTVLRKGRDEGALWLRRRSLNVWSWHLGTLAAVCCLILGLSPWGWRELPGLEEGSFLFMKVVSAVLMLNRPDYLDVLPLYVLLLFSGSLILPRLAGKSPYGMLLGSFLVWCVAQMGAWSAVRHLLPVWMHPGLFDPLSWQLLFFGGSSLALMQQGAKPAFSLHRPRTLLPLLALALVFAAWQNGLTPLPAMPDKGFWASRSHLGPLRLLSFTVALALVVSVIRVRPQTLDWAPTRLLGSHSLVVYSLHLPLLYAWIFRPIEGSSLLQVLVPLTLLIPLLVAAHLHGRWKKPLPFPHAGPPNNEGMDKSRGT